MKWNCELIQDLLPLYAEGLCSGASRQAVEEHLNECDVCRRLNGPLSIEVPAEPENADRAVKKSIRRVRRRWLASLLAAVLMLPLLFAGVILLIVASQYFNWPGAIQPGGVMLCILLFNQPVDSYVSYSLDRILDTAVGVVVAILVNVLLPRERIDRFFVWLCGGMHVPAPWPREDEANK